MEYKIGTDARCAVIGYGSWATAIVGLLAANGRRVRWYVRNPEVLESLCSDGRNPRYLNDLEFDRNSIAPSSDLDAVVRDADIVILATPSAYLKDFLAPLTVPLRDKFVVSAIKGIVPGDYQTVVEYIHDHYGLSYRQIGLVTGPSHAEEVSRGKLSYLTVVCADPENARRIGERFAGENICFSYSADLYGVEYAAILKNIYALSVGIAVGLGYAGYPEMQKTLQELVRNKLTSVQRIEVASDQFGNQDVVSSVLQRDANAIRMTAEALDRAQMTRAVGAILRARCIYIVGVRSSAALANYLNFYFRNIFENVRLVSSTATSEMFEQLLRVGHEDVVIGISISTGTGRRRNHQFREQPAQLEPVAEHVVRPFEFQRAVRLVRRGTVFLDHAVQGVQRDQSGDHLQPAIDGFVGGDRARNAHGIGHRRATAGLTDPLVTIAPTAGGLPVGGHHGHRQ